MTVKEITEALKLEVISGAEGLMKEVDGGYVCDLLSDVMGSANEGEIWVTLQTHKNVMAIASLKELAAIILVKGLKPDEDTKTQSQEEGIPILSTSLSAFEISGRLYKLIND